MIGARVIGACVIGAHPSRNPTVVVRGRISEASTLYTDAAMAKPAKQNAAAALRLLRCLVHLCNGHTCSTSDGAAVMENAKYSSDASVPSTFPNAVLSSASIFAIFRGLGGRLFACLQ